MKRIYKFPIRAAVELPTGAKILQVGDQDNALVMWAEVDLNNALEMIYFDIVGTGWEVPDNGEYLGTVQAPDGFVWHIYRRHYE